MRIPVTAISDDGSAVTPEILDQVFDNVKEIRDFIPRSSIANTTTPARSMKVPYHAELGVPGIPGRHRTENRRTRYRDGAQNRRARALPARQHRDFLRRDPQRPKLKDLPITCETAPHYVAL